MIEMELIGVRIELPENAPIALLRERTGLRRVLPIYIGNVEATAIAYATQGLPTRRPMTHDLMKDVIEGLGAAVTRIEVTELREHIFFADIVIDGVGESRRISSRPSDAIALAVRTGSPIFADEDLLDEVAIPATDEHESSELVEEFREFIEGVNPEDFAS